MSYNQENIHKHTFLGGLPSYFARRAKSEVRELFLNSAILDLAMAMILFFEPIYLYQQRISLKGIVLFYLSVYIIYFFLMPIGGKFARKRGFEHGIFLGSPFLILYYLSLSLIPKSIYFLIPAVFALALQKTFYWPGFHADFVYYGQDVEQGREVSNIVVIISLVYIIGPFLGGSIMYFFNFTTLFIIVSILIALSNVPLLLTPERFTPSDFSYFRPFKMLFKRENFRRLLAYIGFGEEFVLLVFWPIFIFIILKNTFNAGLLVAFTTLATSIIVLYIGKLTDKKSKRSLLKFTSVVYSISWFIRALVKSGFGVFLADTFSRVGKNSLSVPLTSITYEKARKAGVVDNVIFFEMSLVVGKIIAMIVSILILTFAPDGIKWQAIFIMSAFFTLLYGLL